MPIEDTSKIIQVKIPRVGTCREVNDYLALGWILLGVFTQSSVDGEDWAGSVFTLGWQKDGHPQFPPDSFYARFPDSD